MPDLYEAYANDLHRHFGRFYANWPPNNAIRLGDFGELRNNTFQRVSDITTHFGLQFAIRNGSEHAASYAYTSADGTRVRFHGKGDASSAGIALPNASLEINFANPSSVFFHAASCQVDSIEDQVALGHQILELFANKRWQSNWAIVTRLVRAGATTVVIAGSENASLVLEAKAEIPQIDLNAVDLGLAVKGQEQIGYTVITERKLVPLLGISMVRRRFLSGPELSSFEDQSDPEALRDSLVQEQQAIPDHFEFAEIQDEAAL